MECPVDLLRRLSSSASSKTSSAAFLARPENYAIKKVNHETRERPSAAVRCKQLNLEPRMAPMIRITAEDQVVVDQFLTHDL
jgi:hypothetical protein